MQEDTKRVLDSLIELWNTGNTSIVRRVYSDSAKRYAPNHPDGLRGPDEIAQFVNQVRTAFPDFRVEVKETVTEGNRLTIHWSWTGTHKGEFEGVAPTGKPVKQNGLTLYRLENGRIAEETLYFDRFRMYEQLGVTPPLGQARRAGY